MKPRKTTAKDLIAMRLLQSERALAIHELEIPNVSQTSASARLREMARDGVVVSVPVSGKRYTAWMLAKPQGELPLCPI